jgi:NAD(P)-dependent dehydrogenase (short-subunit alcohol dehydrogenase family)
MMKKHIFITGVSSGLGHGLAKTFLEQGARVSGCSRRVPGDLIKLGLEHIVIDLSEAQEGERRLAPFVESMQSLDLVILNAGKLGEIRDMSETPLADLRETMEINVWANKWMLDLLFDKVGTVQQVVAISSGASQSGSRGWNGYSMSKVALNMLIKLYAGEVAQTHFTSLAPGLIDTAMQDYLTGLPADDRYAPLDILKSAKGTDKMPDGERCARMLADVFPRLLTLESGSYADVRKLA